ncbi:DUF692 domain-containing protein [Shewanella eurypsychrophilus]|uniref:DUF692 domain-containing protein n=1 Tax=Shewanella eurypsychrophilus TaxID=2593656 RepID=A0ABX6VBX1_9GAMM|nr:MULTISPECIES: DUF692 domain-containing protein [Shewanella]QFU24957.1 DUF692 family protein [Shewanella sp. YLB-09]QPG60134.1 DUF692 domain-containing protein [Shewanella eurypsychrophilus]
MVRGSLVGAGIGLRLPHVQQILAAGETEIPWFEVLADNWLVDGGLNKHMLAAIAERYPIVLHSVGLSVGGPNELDFSYLNQIKNLKQQTGALWYSEHASFSGNDNLKVPDLLPLPYTSEAVAHLSQRIKQVQDFMGERILLENVSTYVSCQFNEMTEGEFIAAVAREADCYLLLDINNAFVTSKNLNQDMQAFMDVIPVERVKQIHLAGFHDKGDYLLDAHNHPVDKRVWQAFKLFIAKHGHIPSMIEWDNDLPPLERLLAERTIAAEILQAVCPTPDDVKMGGKRCA